MAEASLPVASTPQRLDIGRVLERGFSITFKHLFRFAGVALIVTSASFAYSLAFNAVGVETPGVAQLAGVLVQLFLTTLAAAAMVYGTVQELNGKPVRFGACLRHGLAVLFPAFGVALLFTIMFYVGLIAFFLPALVVATFWWVAIPAAVLERRGVFASFGRSIRLTKGNRWRVFAIIVVTAIFMFVVFLVLIILISGTASSGFMALSGAPVGAVIVFAILFWLVGTYFTIFVSVLMTASYHDLRIANEGGSAEDIAAVFD